LPVSAIIADSIEINKYNRWHQWPFSSIRLGNYNLEGLNNGCASLIKRTVARLSDGSLLFHGYAQGAQADRLSFEDASINPIPQSSPFFSIWLRCRQSSCY
jgi:hypothetical protein